MQRTHITLDALYAKKKMMTYQFKLAQNVLTSSVYITIPSSTGGSRKHL